MLDNLYNTFAFSGWPIKKSSITLSSLQKEAITAYFDHTFIFYTNIVLITHRALVRFRAIHKHFSLWMALFEPSYSYHFSEICYWCCLFIYFTFLICNIFFAMSFDILKSLLFTIQCQ